MSFSSSSEELLHVLCSRVFTMAVEDNVEKMIT
jgi:hypothetical protein